jgi:uncharacterized YigZ family protein
VRLQVPAAIYEHEYVQKKSRFIARVVPVNSRDEVKLAVQQSRRDYPDARHHCWAYLLGRPEDAINAGMSDDGEPAGTAGKPILNVLQHGHLGNVLVIVVRYFGGIKLGAGGLVRAYGSATQLALQDTPVRTFQQMSQLLATLDFSAEQALRHWLQGAGGEVLAVDYAEQVLVTLAIASPKLDSLREFCGARGIELQGADDN